MPAATPFGSGHNKPGGAESWVRGERSGTICWICDSGAGVRTSIRIQANRIERRIDDSERVVLREKSVFVDHSRLQAVNTLYI